MENDIENNKFNSIQFNYLRTLTNPDETLNSLRSQAFAAHTPRPLGHGQDADCKFSDFPFIKATCPHILERYQLLSLSFLNIPSVSAFIELSQE